MAEDREIESEIERAEERALFHHTELPETGLSRAVDRVLLVIGQAFSWLWAVLVVIILGSVIARYYFQMGTVGIEEVQWHLSSTIWLIGLSYAIVTDHHVRVDLLYERFGLKTRAWIEFFGIIILLLPFLIIGIYETIPYFIQAYQVNEASQSPGGIPHRWVIKAIMTVAFVLMLIAAVARLLKCTALLFGAPRPMAPSGSA